MKIKDTVFKDTVKRIESYEERLYAHPMHKDADLDRLYTLYLRKQEVSSLFCLVFYSCSLFPSLFSTFLCLLPLRLFHHHLLLSLYASRPGLNVMMVSPLQKFAQLQFC